MRQKLQPIRIKMNKIQNLGKSQTIIKENSGSKVNNIKNSTKNNVFFQMIEPVRIPGTVEYHATPVLPYGTPEHMMMEHRVSENTTNESETDDDEVPNREVWTKGLRANSKSLKLTEVSTPWNITCPPMKQRSRRALMTRIRTSL